MIYVKNIIIKKNIPFNYLIHFFIYFKEYYQV